MSATVQTRRFVDVRITSAYPLIEGELSEIVVSRSGPEAAVPSKFGSFLRILATPAPMIDWAIVSLRKALISVDDCKRSQFVEVSDDWRQPFRQCRLRADYGDAEFLSSKNLLHHSH